MPKRFTTKIGSRDLDLLTAIDRTPLTAAQLCTVSQTFSVPFHDEHNLRRRLRRLSDAGLLKSWSYAIVSNGRSPQYFKLTREGYRLLYGASAALPRRRYFEEVSHGHHYHTCYLADVIVHLAATGHQQGIDLRHFARENSVKLEAGGFTMYPDCAFQLVTGNNQAFNFVLELDNGTERMRSRQDVESIERKIRGYDIHQSQFAADDPNRYVVLFVTTRSVYRLPKILSLADTFMQNRQRTVFVGCDFDTLLAPNPFHDAVFTDHRCLRRTIIPMQNAASKKQHASLTVTPVS